MPALGAPGFILCKSSPKLLGHTFPDASSCTGLAVTLRSTTDFDGCGRPAATKHPPQQNSRYSSNTPPTTTHALPQHTRCSRTPATTKHGAYAMRDPLNPNMGRALLAQLTGMRSATFSKARGRPPRLLLVGVRGMPLRLLVCRSRVFARAARPQDRSLAAAGPTRFHAAPPAPTHLTPHRTHLLEAEFLRCGAGPLLPLATAHSHPVSLLSFPPRPPPRLTPAPAPLRPGFASRLATRIPRAAASSRTGTKPA